MLTFLRFIYFFDDSSNKSIPSIETYYCQITQVNASPGVPWCPLVSRIPCICRVTPVPRLQQSKNQFGPTRWMEHNYWRCEGAQGQDSPTPVWLHLVDLEKMLCLWTKGALTHLADLPLHTSTSKDKILQQRRPKTNQQKERLKPSTLYTSRITTQHLWIGPCIQVNWLYSVDSRFAPRPPGLPLLPPP